VLKGWVWEGHVHFGRSAVKGAYHLEDGLPAKGVRPGPHDIRLTNTKSETSFGVTIDRGTNMGWESKLHLRWADGQPLIAQLPNDELADVSLAGPPFAELRYAKVFRSERDSEPRAGLASAELPATVPGT
jgi:hypothetical protein